LFWYLYNAPSSAAAVFSAVVEEKESERKSAEKLDGLKEVLHNLVSLLLTSYLNGAVGEEVL